MGSCRGRVRRPGSLPGFSLPVPRSRASRPRPLAPFALGGSRRWTRAGPKGRAGSPQGNGAGPRDCARPRCVREGGGCPPSARPSPFCRPRVVPRRGDGHGTSRDRREGTGRQSAVEGEVLGGGKEIRAQGMCRFLRMVWGPPPIFYYKCAYLQKSLSLLACGKYEEEARWLIFRSIFRGIKCLYVDPPLKPPSLFF